MNQLTAAQRALWVALIGTIVAALFSIRFFRIPAALRLPNHEAFWHAVPYALLLVVISVLLILLNTARKHP